MNDKRIDLIVIICETDNNILATEILIFWKKNSLYSISHEQIFNQKEPEMAEDTKGLIRRTNNTPAKRKRTKGETVI